MRIQLNALRHGEVGAYRAPERSARALSVWQLRAGALWQGSAGEPVWILAVDGRVDVRGCDGRWSLAPREWMLLGAEQAPSLRSGGSGSVLVAALAANHAGLPGELARTLLTPQRGRIGLSAWRSLCALGSEALSSGESELSEVELEQLLDQLLRGSELDRLLQGRPPGRTEARRRQLLSRMLRARLYIEGNADRVVRITELARLCSFSPWHFTKTFHQIFGETPQGCGVRFRLDRARKLVVQSRLAISEIAAACGFENASSFARAFHERFGECASQMRARHAPPPAPLRRLERR